MIGDIVKLMMSWARFSLINFYDMNSNEVQELLVSFFNSISVEKTVIYSISINIEVALTA